MADQGAYLAQFFATHNRPYLIAEIGVNHGGDLEVAKYLITLAKEGGAHAAKFQTYKAAKLAASESPAYWDTTKETCQSQFELFQRYDHFEVQDYRELSQYCQSIGIDFLSTPFDQEAVDFLDELMPIYKIASADLTNIPLLRQVASKHKPVILSTGASTLAEIDTAVATLQANGCQDLTLLHCVLNYPTPNDQAHLAMLEGIKRTFPNCRLGYSDHTLPDPGMLVLTAAWLKGSMVIEKHFTHDKQLPGNDHYHAMDVQDLRQFNQNLDLLIPILGNTTHKHPLASEEKARLHARRSLVLNKDISAGQPLSAQDLTYKRPASGISPLHWDSLIGQALNQDLPADTILQWSHIQDSNIPSSVSSK